MKVLITGGKGQLGTELETILKSGLSELGAVPAEYQNCEIISIDMDDADISNFADVKKVFENNKFDIVFNCAAMTNVDLCETDARLAMKVNSIGAQNIALCAGETGTKIVHVSTDYVFKGDGTAPYGEWDFCEPKTIYGKSKLLGENYVLNANPKSFVVRTAWLYGYYGNNFVKTIMKAAREKGKLSVVNDQTGCPTNAADLAYHLLKIALTDYYGVYHCVGKGVCTWFDFAAKIVEYAGIKCDVSPCTTEEFPRPAPRPAYSVLDCLMLECTVGNEMREWEGALKYYIKKMGDN